VKGEPTDALTLAPKAIDNSQVVRQRDPRTGRQLTLLLAAVAILVLGLVLHAWPTLELRQAGLQREQLARERERLLEENRKLRLEKAALEDLRRVEAIATRQLGLVSPPADQVVVVERKAPSPAGSRVARRAGEGQEQR
jgi:cell division protein FtsL